MWLFLAEVAAEPIARSIEDDLATEFAAQAIAPGATVHIAMLSYDGLLPAAAEHPNLCGAARAV